MTRPRKEEKDRLTHTMAWRVTESVKQEFERQYAEAGMTQSEFLRELLQRNKVTIVAKPRPSLDFKKLIFLFSKAGNNLNQLAHRANGAYLEGTANETTYRGILAALESIKLQLLRGIDHAG